MVIMISARGLGAAGRQRLSEWYRANGVDDAAPLAGPYVVDEAAGTITIHRHVLSDDNPAADFPEVARDENGSLITELITVPLAIIFTPGERPSTAPPASQATAA